MAKTAISTRLDEYIFNELEELSSIRGISTSALIREFVIAGLDKKDSMLNHLESESTKTDLALKLITDTVLGTLYHIAGYANPNPVSNPTQEQMREIISFGSKMSPSLLESRA